MSCTALAEASVIVREHTPLSNLFMCLWFNEVVRFTSRDQLSFPYVLWRLKAPQNIHLFPVCIRKDLVNSMGHIRKAKPLIRWFCAIQISSSSSFLRAFGPIGNQMSLFFLFINIWKHWWHSSATAVYISPCFEGFFFFFFSCLLFLGPDMLMARFYSAIRKKGSSLIISYGGPTVAWSCTKRFCQQV